MKPGMKGCMRAMVAPILVRNFARVNDMFMLTLGDFVVQTFDIIVRTNHTVADVCYTDVGPELPLILRSPMHFLVSFADCVSM
jgi:hypothetical protein